eukprot:4063804-Pyramimonas_sp.AAC.1
MNKVRKRCQWVSGLRSIEWQGHVLPYLDYHPSMENVWTYLKGKGCRLAFEHPPSDGATEEDSRMVDSQNY